MFVGSYIVKVPPLHFGFNMDHRNLNDAHARNLNDAWGLPIMEHVCDKDQSQDGLEDGPATR